MSPIGEPQPTESVAEKSIAFTIASATNDPNTAEGLAQVFLRLYEILDLGDVSWAQGTLTVIVDSGHRGELTEVLESVGRTAVVKDQ